MAITNVLASVAVRDLNSAARWYEEVLGAAPARPMPEVAEWRFERGGGLQVYELPERAGSGSFTVAVSNVDEQKKLLARLHIDPGKGTENEKVKVVMITDPDGNHIAFAEAIDPSLAR